MKILAEVTAAVARWREVAGSHRLPPRDIDEMRPAFEHAAASEAMSLTKTLRARLA